MPTDTHTDMLTSTLINIHIRDAYSHSYLCKYAPIYKLMHYCTSIYVSSSRRAYSVTLCANTLVNDINSSLLPYLIGNRIVESVL